MKPEEAIIHQSKTLAKQMIEIAHLKAKYENLRELSITTIQKQNEHIYQLSKEVEMLKKVLAG